MIKWNTFHSCEPVYMSAGSFDYVCYCMFSVVHVCVSEIYSQMGRPKEMKTRMQETLHCTQHLLGGFAFQIHHTSILIGCVYVPNVCEI